MVVKINLLLGFLIIISTLAVGLVFVDTAECGCNLCMAVVWLANNYLLTLVMCSSTAKLVHWPIKLWWQYPLMLEHFNLLSTAILCLEKTIKCVCCGSSVSPIQVRLLTLCEYVMIACRRYGYTGGGGVATLVGDCCYHFFVFPSSATI